MEKTGSTHSTLRDIDLLIRARYPVIYVLSHEEERIEGLLAGIAEAQKKELQIWTATRGLRKYEAEPTPAKAQARMNDPVEAIAQIQNDTKSAIYVLKDFHPFLEDPHVVRRLRDAAQDLRGTYKTIVILSPRLNLPVELEKDVHLIDFPLPDVRELTELFAGVVKSVQETDPQAIKLNVPQAEQLVRAAQGLTLLEAENAFAKSLVNDGVLDEKDVKLVAQEKEQIIRKSGILEYYASDASLTEVGGLRTLKSWLAVRADAYSKQAAEFGLPDPRGLLLLGAPGCGKSLTAKAVAAAWGLPLLRLDFGKIFAGLVGSSEENVRRALKVAEGVAPAVLWIDEIEKGLAGGVSGGGDSGTAARVFGTFLTWMQEKKAQVFVIATANRIEALPPELLRRGRFDEIFFIDLPSPKAREEILRIHLSKRKRKPETFDLIALAKATEGFSGAEIEHCLTEGLFAAYHQRRDLSTADVLDAAKTLVPLSVTYGEELTRIRSWCRNRARAADAPASAPPAVHP
jgi:AAA+ superfamily predicted ATPase